MLVWFPYSCIKTFWSVWQYHLATTRSCYFFSTTLWFHELLMTGLTQRRTDSLNEHKMTWLTYAKTIICTLLNVTVTPSNHSTGLFSDFHTWHNWNIYISTKCAARTTFQRHLWDSVWHNERSCRRLAALHVRYVCSTGLVYIWKTRTRFERPSRWRNRSPTGLTMNFRKAPQTLAELCDSVALHIGAYH